MCPLAFVMVNGKEIEIFSPWIYTEDVSPGMPVGKQINTEGNRRNEESPGLKTSFELLDPAMPES